MLLSATKGFFGEFNVHNLWGLLEGKSTREDPNDTREGRDEQSHHPV
jgi:hypothetical protein